MARLRLGQVYLTPGAKAAFDSVAESPFRYLMRHTRGDWGDVPPTDAELNDMAVQAGERVLSAYHLSDGTRIWIITERDRSSTTLLLPVEY